MVTTEHSTVVGIFADPPHAQKAMEDLRRAGFRADQIGIAVRDQKGEEESPGADEETKGEKAAEAGLLTGGALGSLVGAALATGLIPGIGPVIAGGLLVGMVAGTTVGAVAGGCVGALVGLGVPEKHAHHYNRALHEGRTVVTIQAEDRSAEAMNLLRRHGAEDLYHFGTEEATHVASKV